MPESNLINRPEIVTHAEPSLGDGSDSLERKVDLVQLATLLLRGKKTTLRFMLAAAVLAAVLVYLVMKPTYTAVATFLPPQTSPGSSLSQLANQMGALGSLGGLSTGIKNPGDIYIGILGSRTIADDLISRFNLQSVYRKKRISDTEKALEKNSTFSSGKDTLVTIKVQDHDPRRAADIANAYLDSLRKQNGRLALTESSQRRLFFEDQLVHEKDALADAEVELKRTQEKTGLIIPVGQAQVEIETIAQLRAQITSREVALSALKQAATEENPQVVRLQTEIAGLQSQLQKQERSPETRQPGNVQPPMSRVPELALEVVRKLREVKYHEVLFDLIAKQYEAARLDESREAPILQVVDYATVPDRKSGPPRTLLVLAAALLGGLAGAGWVIQKEMIAKLQSEPKSAAKLESLRQAALWKH